MLDKYIFNKIDIFNFLRGIAILCVLGLHTPILVVNNFDIKTYPFYFNTPAWLAMWMFFFLSGYLLGKGFFNNKYEITKNGIFKFYCSRLIRILPLYFLLLFIVFIFYNPNWFIDNPISVLHIFTFTYNGIPGINGVGHTWFISAIVQLYVLAPFGYKLFSYFNKGKKNLLILFFLLIAIGIGYRLLTDLFKLDYYKYVYTFSLANIDLFFCGLLLNSITKNSLDNKLKENLRPISLCFLFTLILTYMLPVIKLSWWVYNYIYPSLTLLSMALIVYAFDYAKEIRLEPLTLLKLIKNPLRIIEYIGIISFNIYLFHGNIMEMVVNIFKQHKLNSIFTGDSLFVAIFVLMFVVAFVFATFLHYTIEVPMNKLRSNIK